MNIGLVIGTFNSVPYIHLFLESAKRHFPHIPIIVNDDCSKEKKQLSSLCQQYQADFHCNTRHLRHLGGDLSAFQHGLEWAKKNQLDLLVKMSRRFIPLFDWSESLSKIAHKGHTFTNHCRHGFGYPEFNPPAVIDCFRTQCIGMKVDFWYEKIPTIEKLTTTAYNVEKQICNLANRKYIPWTNVKDGSPNILWHKLCSRQAFHQKANEFGLTYPLKSSF